MRPDQPEYVVLQHAQVEHDAVALPCNANDEAARDGVEDEMIGFRDGCDENYHWVCDANDKECETRPAREHEFKSNESGAAFWRLGWEDGGDSAASIETIAAEWQC
jgi:hypothetical protein